MSLINEALKRASEAQAQAAQRPRGPKGIEDLPAPMTPVAARERPAWLPVLLISLLVAALLGASGYFFMQWWKERQNFQPYATENIDENGFPRTNKPVAKAESPKVTPGTNATLRTNATPGTNVPVVTNPPPTTKVAVIPPTPEPPKTNPPVAVVATNPPPPPKLPDPPVPKTTNPVVPVVVDTSPPPLKPPVIPPATTNGGTNLATTVSPPVKPTPPTPPDATKKDDEHATKTPAIEFPELKLQGISRRKNKTFAILNGKTLTAGDRVEGVLLLKIDTDSVTVEKGGARRELFLLR